MKKHTTNNCRFEQKWPTVLREEVKIYLQMTPISPILKTQSVSSAKFVDEARQKRESHKNQ